MVFFKTTVSCHVFLRYPIQHSSESPCLVEQQMAARAALTTNSAASLFFSRRRIASRTPTLSVSSSSSSSTTTTFPYSFSSFLSLQKPKKTLTSRRPASLLDAFEGPKEPSPPFSIGGAAWCLLVAALCYLLSCRQAVAAVDSIRASGIGLKVAAALRRVGWMDEAVVFALATLPVIELRGAIPVGYWMQLSPIKLTVLSILGFALFLLLGHFLYLYVFWPSCWICIGTVRSVRAEIRVVSRPSKLHFS